MFGIVCGGRPVETNVSQIEPNKFVFVIQQAAKINYMAIFLLPGNVLPSGSAASVYAQMPGKDFTLLGALTDIKQSAIFKFNTSATSANVNDVDVMVDEEEQAAASEFEINIGISIESALQVEQQLNAIKQQQVARQKVLMPPSPAKPAAPQAPQDIAALANKIVAHAYNYISSFVNPQGQVPIKAFDDWWAKFKTRLSTNPSFLESLES